MPDSAPPADGSALTSSWLQTMVREQVVRTVTSSTRPTGVEGCIIYETDTDDFYYYTGSAWAGFGGKVVQMVNTQTGAVATGTTTLPADDTIPQNTEGTQFMTLAITPQSSANTLLIEVQAHLSPSVATSVTGAIFQDSTAGALAAKAWYESTATGFSELTIRHKMTAGTTSATTFKFRAGMAGAGTLTFNGQGGGRLFGGVMASSITIWEIAA